MIGKEPFAPEVDGFADILVWDGCWPVLQVSALVSSVQEMGFGLERGWASQQRASIEDLVHYFYIIGVGRGSIEPLLVHRLLTFPFRA